MASPLLEFANARIKVEEEGSVSAVNGRLVKTPGDIYLVLCFLKRIQYTGVSSGSRKVPLESQLEGRMMPGASGDSFYYRGYALEKAVLSESDDWLSEDISGLEFETITSQEIFLKPGTNAELKLGNDPLLYCRIERSSGQFGGDGIDKILYAELGGVELQLTAGELQN
jgi:hypothetical protein